MIFSTTSMNTLRPCLCLFLMLLLGLHGVSQPIRFEHITYEHILDRQPIVTIAQDMQGRLWFGGQQNLFVYDSYHIKNLLLNDSLFKRVSYVRKVAINSDNHLFITQLSGFEIYDINNLNS